MCIYAGRPQHDSFGFAGFRKNINQFHNDDEQCKQFAHEQVSEISANKTSAWIVQRQYDFSYLQCMYAQGHRVPVD